MNTFGFGKEDNYALTDTLGIERETFQLPDSGQKGLFVHQTQYSEHAVEEYEKAHYGGKVLPGISTPLATKEVLEDQGLWLLHILHHNKTD